MNTIDLTPDTGVQGNAAPHPDDPHQIAGGGPQSPGGTSAPREGRSEMTHGQDGYPGPRSDSQAAAADQTPAAGDTDPDSTASAEQTGQAGDLSATRQDPQKNKGNAWNG